MAHSTPSTTSDVTAAWLTDALREGGTIPGTAMVASVESDPAAAGVGFMGEVGTLQVTYGGEGAVVRSFVARGDARAAGTCIYFLLKKFLQAHLPRLLLMHLPRLLLIIIQKL